MHIIIESSEILCVLKWAARLYLYAEFNDNKDNTKVK